MPERMTEEYEKQIRAFGGSAEKLAPMLAEIDALRQFLTSTREELASKSARQLQQKVQDLAASESKRKALTAEVERLAELADKNNQLCAECGRGFLDSDWAMERKALAGQVERFSNYISNAKLIRSGNPSVLIAASCSRLVDDLSKESALSETAAGKEASDKGGDAK